MSRPRSLLAALVLLVPLLGFGHDAPDQIVIDAAAAKQPPVPFSHGLHAAKLVKTCHTCHHTQKGLTSDADTKVILCSTCHLDPKEADVPGMKEMSLTKNPFHIRCIGCHKSEKKGPVVCRDCHKK